MSVKPPRANPKPPYWKLSGDGSVPGPGIFTRLATLLGRSGTCQHLKNLWCPLFLLDQLKTLFNLMIDCKTRSKRNFRQDLYCFVEGVVEHILSGPEYGLWFSYAILILMWQVCLHWQLICLLGICVSYLRPSKVAPSLITKWYNFSSLLLQRLRYDTDWGVFHCSLKFWLKIAVPQHNTLSCRLLIKHGVVEWFVSGIGHAKSGQSKLKIDLM